MKNLNNNEIKKALQVVNNKTGGFREKDIIANFESYEYAHNEPVANIYGKDGNGFQVVVKPFNGHKVGDITN